MPKFRPRTPNNARETTTSVIESTEAIFRNPMKLNGCFCVSAISQLPFDRQFLDPAAAVDNVHNGATDHQATEHRGQDTDAQCYREPFDRAGTHGKQDHSDQQRSYVGIKDRHKGPTVPRVNRTLRRHTCFKLFLYSLKD